MPLLELDQMESGYGETMVTHGVSLAIETAHTHAILGRNGVGKTTTLKTVAGLITPEKGAIRLSGVDIQHLPAHAIARRGIAYVPETRDIFGALTVLENLELAGRLAKPGSGWSIDDTISFFPNLANRLYHGGHQLSGGEQQMLAIGRALMTDPDILILDEPTEGLAPIIIDQMFEKLTELKSRGMTILLVEQNLHFALGLADQVSLMSRGQIVWQGLPDALKANHEEQARWLGV